MATVYLALDERRLGVHRLCAVKVPHADLRDRREGVDMFADEARIAAQLAHPNVCAILDHGIDEGLPFLVMEYVCGETLGPIRRALAGPSAPRPDRHGAARAALIARMVADVALGLHALHELAGPDGAPLGAIHRDVSPDNVIVSCCGPAKLLDFGLVRSAGQQHESRDGLLKGKLSYLPPEVLESAPSLDRRGDVWALGVMLWELLTSRRLFRRDGDAETLRAVRRAPIEPPSRDRPDLPRSLDAVVLAALARDPGARFADARDFAEALLEAATGRGARPDALDVQRFVRDRFDHDSSCPQRRLREAREAIDAEPTTSTRHLASTHAPGTARRGRAGAAIWGGACAGVAALGWLAGASVHARAPLAASALGRTAQRVADDLAGSPTSSYPNLFRVEIVDAAGRRLIAKPVSDIATEVAAGATPPSSR